MNHIPDWVVKKFERENDSTITTFYYLMKELHISYDTLCEMPVPTIILLTKELEKQNKKEEKLLKKTKR